MIRGQHDPAFSIHQSSADGGKIHPLFNTARDDIGRLNFEH